MARNETWSNADGLNVGFGTHTADNTIARVVSTDNMVVTTQQLFNLLDLEDTDAITVASMPVANHVIPRGSRITKADLVVTVGATSGGAATLDIGTYEAGGDGSATGDDLAAGIDVDIAVTALNVIGDAVICNGALVNGVLTVGAVSTSDVVVVCGFEAAAFTAGQIILTVSYIPPSINDRVILTTAT
jgi:hypothetical protein